MKLTSGISTTWTYAVPPPSTSALTHGEISFGALQARLDLEYARLAVYFEWEGFDEMDETRGSGSADLQDDGSLEVEFAYQHGDEDTLRAVKA